MEPYIITTFYFEEVRPHELGVWGFGRRSNRSGPRPIAFGPWVISLDRESFVSPATIFFARGVIFLTRQPRSVCFHQRAPCTAHQAARVASTSRAIFYWRHFRFTGESCQKLISWRTRALCANSLPQPAGSLPHTSSRAAPDFHARRSRHSRVGSASVLQDPRLCHPTTRDW